MADSAEATKPCERSLLCSIINPSKEMLWLWFLFNCVVKDLRCKTWKRKRWFVFVSRVFLPRKSPVKCVRKCVSMGCVREVWGRIQSVFGGRLIKSNKLNFLCSLPVWRMAMCPLLCVLLVRGGKVEYDAYRTVGKVERATERIAVAEQRAQRRIQYWGEIIVQ